MSQPVVVVTGAGSGIGAATSALLAERGARVIVADIRADAAADTSERIRSKDGEAQPVALDVTDRNGWAEMVARVATDWGPISGLVNNAGLTKDRSLLKMTDDEWAIVLDVNLRGAWLGCQAVIPGMRDAGGGSIVNLSSESRAGAFGQANYASAKAGIVGLTKTVALEGARYGVRCNAIAPGTIDTPMVEAVPQEIRESWLPGIPLARLGRPSEVAAAVHFLLTDESSYITGQVLQVDGGSSL